MLVRNQVKPLPALVYDFADLPTALRQFATAKHVGKIVVRLPTAAVDAVPTAARDTDRAWIVSGGLGALGTIAAKWLAGQGRRNICLLGRSGRAAAKEEASLQELLSKLGSAQITMSKCDTASLDEAAAMVHAAAGQQAGSPGIAGVLLAGGVLNDAMLPSQTAGTSSPLPGTLPASLGSRGLRLPWMTTD